MDFLSADNIKEKIDTGEVSAQEVCEHFLDVIDQRNPQLNAMLWTNPEALKKAEAIDKGAFVEGRLRGVPIVVKDNFCVQGMKTTAASRILENFQPPYTAHCIQRLEDEGAIVLGKANLDEFAMGSSNETSYFGACKNPWNTDFVPGGSSGGSAAAVASGMAPLSIGSDTGGSIRQPASFCGVVGIKPTYGTISRYGMIAFASSLDQAGPLAKTVKEAALALDVMINKDVRDGTNVKRVGATIVAEKKQSLSDLKVGVPKEYLSTGLDSDFQKSFQTLLDSIKSQGCEIVEIELPHTEYAVPTYYLIASSEASSNLSRYDGVRYGLRNLEKENGLNVKNLSEFYKLTRSRGFGDEVKRRILLGTFSLSAGYYDAFYTKACQVRRLIYDDFIKAFQSCDFILGPVTQQAAFRLNEKIQDPISMYYNDVLTVPASLAGLPSMSLPLALNSAGLPLGLQLIMPPFLEDKMIAVANTLEEIIQFDEVNDAP